MAFSPFRSSPALRSWFAFRDPALLFARATLDEANLALTGWTWNGRYRRCIPLDRILHVDAKTNDELVLWLFDGETLRLHIKQPAAWKAALNALASKSLPHPTTPKP